MIKKIREIIKARKLRKQEKTELVAMIEDLDQKLKVQIDRSVANIEQLEQDKLYFLYLEIDDVELEKIKLQFAMIKKGMKWTTPNVMILNRPLIELSQEKLKELEIVRQKLVRKK